jgi:hypothetical protein
VPRHGTSPVRRGAAGRAVLLHKVVEDTIAVKLFFNGRAGWLGLGIENLIG